MSNFCFPVRNVVVTQHFGERPEYYRKYGFPGHEGVDFGGSLNTPIYAIGDGTVSRMLTPDRHAYGNHIRILHHGFESVYAHLNGFAKGLRPGSRVLRGQLIGYMGNTGNSTGVHLHLTLKRSGASVDMETGYPKDVVDPLKYITETCEGME